MLPYVVLVELREFFEGTQGALGSRFRRDVGECFPDCKASHRKT